MHATTHQLIAIRDSEPVEADVSVHVRECSQCQADLARLTATRDALRDLAPQTPPSDGWQRLEHDLARQESAPPTRWRPWPALVAGLAATVLIVLWILPGDKTGQDIPTADATIAAIESLASHSRFLQSAREAIGSRDLPLDYATAATLTELEAGIELIDRALDDQPPPETRHQLWSQRVDLLEAIVAIELTESGWAAAQTLPAESI